jgi:UDP-2,3-diacylglucosamine hydrolase
MTAVATDKGPVAIICGGGTFPRTIAEAVTKQGRGVVLFPLRGFADPDVVERFPHHWMKIGQVGWFVKTAQDEGAREVIMIGSLVRPAISQLALDWKTLLVLPKVFRAYYGGDDHLLSGVARIFEEHGFRLLGAHEVAPDILVPEGVLGAHKPGEGDSADIKRGLALLHALGPYDVGQAAVVANNHVLAVEASEGTDGMLARVAELRRAGRIRMQKGGVLVKAPKPGQDRRFDLPSIGPRTIENAAAAGLAGVAVIAGGTIVAEPQALIDAADKAGLFVLGIRETP